MIKSIASWVSEVDWAGVGAAIAAIVDFAGDLVTAIVGVATFYAFLRYGPRIQGAIKLLRNFHLEGQIAEIHETLKIIEASPVPKAKTGDLRDLFGRLNGQLKPLCAHLPSLKPLQAQIDEIAHSNGVLTGAVKLQIVHQLKAEIADEKLQRMNQAIGGR